ncbi:unnamed protein product [Porites evermanni]|uniref:Integrase core domain-containing protein n=1 Tax=Porites evermanni TaxID=104178 RepID=A0ABN8LUH8_9CNID|nr:unnamed protein product [Porites evermanni]
MVFCQVCETKVQEGGNYCHNCGAGVESFQNDPEREIIERYFHLGYKYNVIINFLRSKHDICMNVRTLKRRLVKYKLSRNETWRSEEEVKNIIKEEMQGSGCLSGYRKMWHLLKIKYNMHVPRNMVAQILHDLDPEASSLRKKKKLKRRHYLSHGPNQCWHIDGYDKLKPFGFPIHAGVDGYSRKVLWVELERSNNLPEITARYYLECVKEHGFCPLQTRTDCGTENGIIAAMQCYFRSEDSAPHSGESAHIYGTSTGNQRVENWWSHYWKSSSSWWIQFFKDLLDSGRVDIANETHKECLWFCFHGILQQELDKMKLYWNTHHIRPSRHDTVGGVPDVLFQLPEESVAFDCSVPVSRDKILEMESKCAYEEEENVFQEYFHYVMEEEGLHYPSNHEEALRLFFQLVNVA